ncbi:acetylornithine deacetylase, partial [Klebsiella quasipneumoniae]|nr:acetylornithine deacetylase [Klebsiella quasipneumoniae]
MKNNLRPFIESYRALIAKPSISAMEEALDRRNASLLNLLPGSFPDLGFNVQAQPVPYTRQKFKLLVITGHASCVLLLALLTDALSVGD